jgi:hypothetical protein
MTDLFETGIDAPNDARNNESGTRRQGKRSAR